MKKVDVFTDGACSGNPGPGGWGALLRFRGKEREISGAEAHTTNNRMELMAVISALETLSEPCHVTVHTDSKYVLDGATKWLDGWRKRGWKTADKKAVMNPDLWQRLEKALSRHKTDWSWIKGHSGHAENERVDALARQAILDAKED